METLLVLIIFSLAIVCMALGVIFNNKPLAGSCGGLNQDGNCSICGGNKDHCENSEVDTKSL